MVLFAIYFILSLLILLFMIIYALKTDKELDVKGGPDEIEICNV